MAITIDWSTRVISVPKADLVLVQSTPVEIREMNLNWFRMQLKDLEDNADGMVNPDTHRHNTEVTLGGLTYARIIEIINGYTVTFSDGQYAVNLVGANSNVADVVNVNQVSVRSANSAGMVTSQDIEYSSYGGGVHLDPTSSWAGTLFPVGTPRQPVNNLADAMLICAYRGFYTIFVRDDLIINAGGDYSEMVFIGDSIVKTVLDIEPSALINDTEFRYAAVTGMLDLGSVLRECLIENLYYVNGYVYESILSSGTTIKLGGNIDDNVFLGECKSGFGDVPPVIDFDFLIINLTIRGYKGNLKLIDCTENVDISISLNGARIILDSSVTNGNISITGLGVLENNMTTFSGTLNIEGLLEPSNIAETFMRTPIGDNTEPNSVGLSFANTIYDNLVYLASTGVSGTNYGIGVMNNPSNNIADAQTLLHRYNCNTFYLLSDMTMPSGQEITFHTVEGHGYTFTVESGALVTDAVFKGIGVTGDFGDSTSMHFHDTTLSGCQGVTGFLEGGRIEGALYLVDDNSNWFNAVNCMGGTVGDACVSIYSSNCNILNWQGALCIKDQNNANSEVNISIQAGLITIDESCTAGNIYITGQGQVSDNSQGSNVDISHVLTKESISDAVLDKSLVDYTTPNTVAVSLKYGAFGSAIYIDTTNGESGTDYPYGTPFKPVDSLANALTIANLYNIKEFYFSGMLILGQAYQGWSFIGAAALFNNIIVVNGQDVSYSLFKNCVLTSVMAGINIQYYECVLNDLSGACGLIYNGGLGGTIVIGEGQTFQGKSVSALGTPTILDFNSSGTSLCQLQCENGIFRIDNMVSGSIIQFTSTAGEIEISSSCTGGTVLLSGAIKVTDNSSGVYLVQDSVINNETISEECSDAVWEHVTGAAISANVEFVKNIEGGRWKIENNQMIFYKEDNVTVIASFNLFNQDGDPAEESVHDRQRV